MKKDWRDILAREIDWTKNQISKRAGQAVSHMTRQQNRNADWNNHGAWHDYTLGDIADLGPKHWSKCDGLGEKSVAVIKWVIDEAAEGRCQVKAQGMDAYVPECERGCDD